MAAFIAQNMAPIMFASLVIFLMLGYPVSFSLAFVGLFYSSLASSLHRSLMAPSASTGRCCQPCRSASMA
jgi:TRAP-type mannitol/chloroaromatic compound transport system permease large subunit